MKIINKEMMKTSSRRKFIRNGVALGGLLLTGGMHSTGNLYGQSASYTRGYGSTAITDLDVMQMASLIRDKKLSSVEVVKACLLQIEKVNDRINAVVQICGERALTEAAKADAKLARGQVDGPLHGVPFTIKDSLETMGVISTAGTLGLRNNIPSQDATVVSRLRNAGGILIGKTNTPEFTLGGGARGTWNLVYGQTNNPYNLAHTPRGSSGGAGAIVASCGAPFDIGSDFGGSIRSPAHACGIVGIKPTFGRVPRTGHWPGYGGVFDSYQQLGPLTRSVGDAWIILKIISGPDWKDAAIIPAPMGDPASVSIRKLKIAYYTDNGVVTPTKETISMVESAANALEATGAEVTMDYHGGFSEMTQIRSKLMGADGGAGFQRLLDRAGTKEPSSGIQRYLTGDLLPTDEITRLLEEQDALRSRLTQWFTQYDVIICPTNAFPAPSFQKPVPRNAGYTSLYNVTGWPATVVRCGTSAENLPLGLQVVSRPWREDVSLAVAAYLENQFGGWVKPDLA